MRVAVIGAGIMGASAARSLADRGHEITIYEQFEPGHSRGSSHGRSRIVRKAYLDPFYAQVMLEAYGLWAELEAASGRKLLYETGLLYIAERDSASMKGIVEGLELIKAEFRVQESFDDFIVNEDEVAIWSADGGWAHAGDAVLATLEVAIRAGVKIVRERVDDLESLRSRFDRIMICAGPWIDRFVNLDTASTHQTVAYVAGHRQGPVWIEDGANNLYGFPSEPNRNDFKIGVHRAGKSQNPDEMRLPPDEAFLALIREVCARRFGISDPVFTEVDTCLYTYRADEDFRFGMLDEQVIYGSACSGHGFKFGPWVGRYLADLAEHARDPSEFARWQTGLDVAT